MFKVKQFQFWLVDNKCSSYFSIWNISPRASYQRFWQLIGQCVPCRMEFFPYIFWLVLSLSFMGAYRCFCELVTLYYQPNCTLDMWRPRKFFVLHIEALRRARIVGSIVGCYAWLMMIYALINIQPSLMTPWLVLNSIVLAMDIVMWLIDVANCCQPMRLCSLYPMLRLFCTMALVNCIQTVFENAIKRKMIDALSIFGKQSIFASAN